MRKWINIVESGPEALLTSRQELLGSVSVDERSAAAILGMDEDDHEAVGEAWFESLIVTYKHIAQRGSVPIYRHMKVDDFEDFIQNIEGGAGLGMHWSINPDIESPTWQDGHDGDVEVMVEGEIHSDQINWEATLRQNCEWPHEGELIFDGEVYVHFIENRDYDDRIKVGRSLPR